MNEDMQKPSDALSEEERKAIDEFNEKVSNFIKFKEKAGIKKECVSCGKIGGIIILGYKREYPVIPLNKLGKHYPAYAAACSNCGFVSTYFADVVESIANKE